MTFATLRTRYASFLASGDTNEPPISNANRDAMLNEAFIEYDARFGAVFQYTADAVALGATNNFTIGLAANGQWVECEQMEVKVGSAYIPLKRETFGQILSLTAGEGAQRTPESYGMALVSRNQTTGASLFRVVVYPRPTGTTSYRGRFRPFRSDLVNASDELLMDETAGDRVARIAALRTGLTLGYGVEWGKVTAAPLPSQIKQDLGIDDFVRWSQSEPRHIGELIDGL